MGAVSNFVGGITKAVGSVLSGVVDLAGSVLKTVGDAVSSVAKTVVNTVKNVIKDPIPTLLQIGGAMIGIPPYVTAAAITAAKGGKLEDIAKSAAISYATTSFMSDTQIGADIKNYTSNAFAGDFTDSMMTKFNLTPDQAVQIAKVSTAALNNSLMGGINAALTGKSVAQGISSGFTSGLIYSSTDSFFDSVNKDPNWGFSQQAINLMKGATSTALSSFISGKGDPAQAVGNYIAYAMVNMGGSSLATAAKDAFKLLTTDTEAAKTAQDKYNLLKADYDTKVADGEKLRVSINDDYAAYKKTVDEEYTPFKDAYDKLVADNTAAINDFNTNKKAYDDNKWAYDNYDAKMKQLGYEGFSDDNGTSYGKRIGGTWKEGYDPESGGTYRYYAPDGSIVDSEGYPTTSIRWDAPTQQSYADAANKAADAANAAAEKAKSTSESAQTLYNDNKEIGRAHV